MFGWDCKRFLGTEREPRVRMKQKVVKEALGTPQPAEPQPCRGLEETQHFRTWFIRSCWTIRKNSQYSSRTPYFDINLNVFYPAFNFSFNDAANCQLWISEPAIPLRRTKSTFFLEILLGNLQTQIPVPWLHCSRFQDSVKKTVVVGRRGSGNSWAPSCTQTSAAPAKYLGSCSYLS